MTNENMNAVVKEDVAGAELIEQMKNPNESFFCSIKDDGSRKSKVAIYNAIQTPDGKVADHINETLEVVNVVAHPVTLTDEQTGELFTALRTVLITKDGKSYEAVSGGISNALARVFSIIGEPTDGAWEKEPVKMKIRQVQTKGNNKINTIELV